MGKKKAGCVPIRRRGGPSSAEWEILLVQSRWTEDVWLFPKGTIEKGETAKAAALRETLEEGGVTGDLGPKLGSWTFDKSTKQKQKMWLLFVTTEYSSDSKMWKERNKRKRTWHSIDSARELLTSLPETLRRPQLVEILQAAQGLVNEMNNGVLPIDRGKASDDDDDVVQDE